MIKEKEQRNLKVTVRFTQSEMEMIVEQLQERNQGKPAKEGITVSGLLREKLLILDKGLELKKIRLELTVIDNSLKQIELYLSKREKDAKESFLTEVLTEIEKQLGGIKAAFEEVDTHGGNST